MCDSKIVNMSQEAKSTTENSSSWINWCRLCANRDGQMYDTMSGDTGHSALTTSIGKYFWVNVSSSYWKCSLRNHLFAFLTDKGR